MSTVHHQEYLDPVYTQQVFVILVLLASASQQTSTELDSVEILLMMDSGHVRNMQCILLKKFQKQWISLAFIIRKTSATFWLLAVRTKEISSGPLQHGGHTLVRRQQNSSGPLQPSGCTLSGHNRFQMAYCILLPACCQGRGVGSDFVLALGTCWLSAVRSEQSSNGPALGLLCSIRKTFIRVKVQAILSRDRRSVIPWNRGLCAKPSSFRWLRSPQIWETRRTLPC